PVVEEVAAEEPVVEEVVAEEPKVQENENKEEDK
ncbi:MAG: 30S ribosomal protein S2, partial [Gammaproteobacteria bacterium]|nr:30S ribosomal protein S2 [Gammaproteobacteria bacterium]